MNQKLHHKAERLRETERFEEAIKLYDKVIEGYMDAKNYEGVIDALQGKVLTYKHLYARTKKDKYLKLATGCAETSLKISNKYKIEKMYASAYFRMGEVNRLAKNFKKAVFYFKKAFILVKDNKERGDFLYHLGEALYKSGKRELGKKKIFEGLNLIEKDKDRLDLFVYHVWKSGVYLRLAQIYILEKNDKKAERYIKKASAIIGKDKRLVIRAKQLEEIRSGKYYW